MQDTNPVPNEKTTQTAVVSSKRKLPAIWIVPIIAMLLGLWMVMNHYLTRGPEISISFTTAEGIEAGKTKIKALNVDVGLVESVQLNDDLKSVTIIARMQLNAEPLLREDSKFWVVRPRIGAAGVSGLNTLLSGAFIELSPGENKNPRRDFNGLKEAPITPLSTPGLRITLISDEARSVSIGDPISYRGFRVGRIENTKFDTDLKQHVVNAFIESPYDELVTTSTRFWDSSGISLQASADGISLRTGSFESLLFGGIAFDLPEGANQGSAVENYTEFILYDSADSINENPYQYYEEYILLFDSSVRGLIAGAPVLYRGLRIGTVIDASFKYLDIDMARTKGRQAGIPVLIRLEPGRWLGEDTESAKTKAVADVEKSVAAGLRATLKLGNILTGSLIVSLDFYDDVSAEGITKKGKYNSIPTVATGFEDLQVKVAELLSKLNSLPLEKVLHEADNTLTQARNTLATGNKTIEDLSVILQNEDTQQIPNAINTTIDEFRTTMRSLSPDSQLYLDLSDTISQLNATLRNIEKLTYTIETKPNSLIFSKPKSKDLEPEALK